MVKSVCLSFCLFVRKINRKVVDRLGANFLLMTHGSVHIGRATNHITFWAPTVTLEEAHGNG